MVVDSVSTYWLALSLTKDLIARCIMIPSLRYVVAFVVNVVLPTAAYRAMLPHAGLTVALLASATPLIAWMAVDFLRSRHVDALSSVVLAGIALSLLMLLSQPGAWLRASREPLVSGVIGVLFLGSLALRRPLVFYLARSTLSREHARREREFDAMWAARPALRKSIRLMTAVWGIGLVAENVVRIGIVSLFDGRDPHWLSTCVRYATYGGLTLWTVAYRRLRIKTR